MMRGAWVALLGGLAAWGCAGSEQPPATPAANAPAAPADSLVLAAPGGVTVWFTVARPATAPVGSACVERALEVRTDSTRRGVPLLYTREAPALLGTDAMRAVLYNGCTAGAAYRVDFATVSPRRLSP